MQFRLRTLLIVLAIGPPMLAGAWWGLREWQFRKELKSLYVPFRRAVGIDEQYRSVEEARAETKAQNSKSSK
jgi:hypothetical protein